MPLIKSNSISLYYESIGEGEPLIFISGFTGNHVDWNGVIPAYLQTGRYRVITFDNRGVGQSDCPDQPYTVDQMADDVIGLMDGLKLDRAHFIGSSLGGHLVQNIGYRYPNRIRSGVISNSSAKFHLRSRMYAENGLALMQSNISLDTLIRYHLSFVFSNNYLSKPGMLDQLIQYAKTNPYAITLTGYKNQLNALLTADSREQLKQIQAPCLIITADEDLLASVEQSQHLANTIPKASCFCFPNVGHLPRTEKPEIFNQEVLKFLSEML